MKILVIGHSRNGKDHAAEYLRDNFGITYKGSSELCSEIFIFDELKNKYDYKNPDECFQDRVNHRKEWYDLICDYNSNDPTKLAEQIFDKCHLYCGMRSKDEVDACKDKWSDLLVIYIDRSEVLPPESVESCTITRNQADVVISNNGNIIEFEDKLRRLFNNLNTPYKTD